MPDIVLHNEMATKVLNRIDKNISNFISKPAFFFGVMAPDSYMLYRFFLPHFRKGINKRGAVMHENKCEDLLLELARRSEDNEETFSILSGFLCHFALDSVLHPLINQISNGQAGMHEAIEHALDMRELNNKGQSTGDIVKLFVPYIESKDLSTAIYKVYGWNDKYYKEAYIHQQIYYRICSDRFGVLNLLLKHMNGKLSSVSYHNSKCKLSHLERFDLLIEESIILAEKMIDAAYMFKIRSVEEEYFVDSIGNRNYLGLL